MNLSINFEKSQSYKWGTLQLILPALTKTCWI